MFFCRREKNRDANTMLLCIGHLMSYFIYYVHASLLCFLKFLERLLHFWVAFQHLIWHVLEQVAWHMFWYLFEHCDIVYHFVTFPLSHTVCVAYIGLPKVWHIFCHSTLYSNGHFGWRFDVSETGIFLEGTRDKEEAAKEEPNSLSLTHWRNKIEIGIWLKIRKT